MNRKMLLLIPCSLLAITTSFTVVFARQPNAPKSPLATAMGTAFTYQGQLKKNGTPVTSSCSFRFTLYDAAASGTVVAGPVNGTPNPVSVDNGSFVVDIDFGMNAFNGDARWLKTETQCTGDSGYTALSPLQALTSAPYALALPGLYTQQNITSTNIIGGYNGNSVAPGVYGAVIGGGGTSGHANRVTDHFSTVAGGWNNQAGDDNPATDYAFYASISGGANNLASGPASTISGGNNNSATGWMTTISGGNLNSATNYAATVPGGFQATASHFGEMAFASGDAQTSVYVLRNTSNYTYTTELFLDGANSSQRITIANDRTLGFDILVVARSLNTGASAGYRFEGLIKNVGGTTAFVGTPQVATLGADAGASSWSVSAIADDTNDALVVKVIGSGSEPIHWVASVRTAEVAY